MKVVVIEFAGKGGMAHYVFQLCRGMSLAGADVTLITAQDYELAHLPRPFTIERRIELWDPKPAGELSMRPWAVAGRKLRRARRALRYYRQWLKLVRYVASLKPDVVQLGDLPFPSDILPLTLLRRKVKVLADVCHNVRPYAAGGRSAGLFDRSRVRHFFYRSIYRLFDLVFVHFERNRKEFRETFGVADSKIGVIVHGNEELFGELADPSVTPASLRQRLHIAPEKPVVLFFGTLSRYKGTDVLLEAFPEVQRRTGAQLVLAGYPFHDFDVEEHKALTRTLGVEEAVTWFPQYVASEEIAAWMEMASVVVFPYRDIYQSGALHVAQTFGAPIIASAVGAMQDVIEDEVSGLLVPTGDVAALSAALLRLLEDRTLASSLAARAKADAQSRFSWRAIAETILGRYRDVLGE